VAVTSVQADTAPRVPTVSDDDITHAVCHCNANLGLCGKDVADAQWDLEAEIPCPLCFTLIDGPCPHCGCVGCPDGWETTV
jgi:hypothetical protein